MEEDGGGFIVRLFKDRYSSEELKRLGLSDRQVDAVLFFKQKGYVTTAEYMSRYDIAERTARNDLNGLIDNKVLVREGETNTAKYVFVFNS
jgi:ATP-dependent DNA helicase RecG